MGLPPRLSSETAMVCALKSKAKTLEKRLFSKLVLAVQPHHALSVLSDCASDLEKEVLGGFEYTVNTVIVHQDNSQLPADPEN